MGASQDDKFDHPTQKPLELMRRPILNHTRRGELVYDPFLGSGTTLMAAEATKRSCCGLELDPKYVDVILTRWQQVAGNAAILDGTGATFEQLQLDRSPQTKAPKLQVIAHKQRGRRGYEPGRGDRAA